VTSNFYFFVEVYIELEVLSTTAIVTKKQKWLEEAGIDPAASPLLTKRSTI
jgi:hypothetical protein